jgi:hypothetical protein
MSNKSLFEKLFEEVMENDAAALGIEGGDSAGDMGGEGEDFGGEEGGDEITLTLDKATAEKLMDLLSAAMGGGHEEEGEAGEFGGSEEGEGEEHFGEMGSEDAEDEDEEEDAEEEEDEDEGSLKESPQAQYKNFETESKTKQMTSHTNRKVSGIASNVSGAGKAEKTAQTQGTAHYMPHNDKGEKMQQKSNMKVSGARAANPSGPGKSVFHP